MRKLLITPASNVNTDKRVFISEDYNLFSYVHFGDHDDVSIYDTKLDMETHIDIANISLFDHRLILGSKKYFICSMLSN